MGKLKPDFPYIQCMLEKLMVSNFRFSPENHNAMNVKIPGPQSVFWVGHGFPLHIEVTHGGPRGFCVPIPFGKTTCFWVFFLKVLWMFLQLKRRIFHLPSGEQPHFAMENHHFLWANPLFLWPFSIAFCMFTRGYEWLPVSKKRSKRVNRAMPAGRLSPAVSDLNLTI